MDEVIGIAKTKFLGKEYPSVYKGKYETISSDIEGIRKGRGITGIITEIDKGEYAKTLAGTKTLAKEIQVGEDDLQAITSISKSLTQVGRKTIRGEQAGKFLSKKVDENIWATLGETLTGKGQKGIVSGLTKISEPISDTFEIGTYKMTTDLSKLIGRGIKIGTKPSIIEKGITGITGSFAGVLRPTKEKKVEISLIEKPTIKLEPRVPTISIRPPKAKITPVKMKPAVELKEAYGMGDLFKRAYPKRKKAPVEEYEFIVTPPGKPAPPMMKEITLPKVAKPIKISVPRLDITPTVKMKVPTIVKPTPITKVKPTPILKPKPVVISKPTIKLEVPTITLAPPVSITKITPRVDIAPRMRLDTPTLQLPKMPTPTTQIFMLPRWEFPKPKKRRVPRRKKRKVKVKRRYRPSLAGLFIGKEIKFKPSRIIGLEPRYPIRKKKKKKYVRKKVKKRKRVVRRKTKKRKRRRR